MLTKDLQSKIVSFAPWLLIIFHIIGLDIILRPDHILGLSGFNMLVCSVLVLLSAEDIKKELKLLAFIYVGGMLVEIIGVGSGLLFGAYSYGAELGLKAIGVPVVMGLNWYCIVVASSNIARYFVKHPALLYQALFAAAACTSLDFLIEPVAIAKDFWSWGGGAIPIFNYVCWFVFSFVFSFVYLKNTQKSNNTAIALFFIWIIFFTILNIV
ncbi:carotenoid biosynthesis protein [Aureispira]|nr:carotenoid biosynthesis protein [Aureispira sp.]